MHAKEEEEEEGEGGLDAAFTINHVTSMQVRT
jgi:hypothetical protein